MQEVCTCGSSATTLAIDGLAAQKQTIATPGMAGFFRFPAATLSYRAMLVLGFPGPATAQNEKCAQTFFAQTF